MQVHKPAPGFGKDFQAQHYLDEAVIEVVRAWYAALAIVLGLTSLWDFISSLPCGAADALKCVEPCVQVFFC